MNTLTRADSTEKVSRRHCRNLGWMTPPVFRNTLHEAIASDQRSVFVCDEAAPLTAELAELARAGWSVAAESTTPTMRRDGRTVRWLTPWTGRPINEQDAREWWDHLATCLARLAPGARPLGSPGTTGRDVWLRTIPAGVEYPIMSADSQTFVREIAGQGRIEVMPAPRLPGEAAAGMIPAVYELDGRLAYLGCMSNLPLGEPVEIVSRKAAGAWIDQNPYSPGFASATWRAPNGWKRPGILTANGCDGWPLAGEGWTNLAAVNLARSFGWDVEISRALVWPRTGHPFRVFVDRMTRGMAMPAGPVAGDVWRASWRAMALHTIGAMHAAPRKVTHILPAADLDVVPDDAEHVRFMPAAGIVRYVTTAPALWPVTHHPEWSATIWERARVRLLDCRGAAVGERVGALHLPPATVIGFRTDAIYTTRSPGWLDDGSIGRYRLKRAAIGPFVWPESQTELLGLLDGATP